MNKVLPVALIGGASLLIYYSFFSSSSSSSSSSLSTHDDGEVSGSDGGVKKKDENEKEAKRKVDDASKNVKQEDTVVVVAAAAAAAAAAAVDNASSSTGTAVAVPAAAQENAKAEKKEEKPVEINNNKKTVHEEEEKLQKEKDRAALDAIIRNLTIDNAKINEIAKAIELDIQNALSKDEKLSASSTLKMLPSFVSRPTGTETGFFYALDLGGTNFRVMKLVLEKGTVVSQKFVKYQIPEAKMVASAEELFDFIAQCVKEAFKDPDFAPLPLSSDSNVGLVDSTSTTNNNANDAVTNEATTDAGWSTSSSKKNKKKQQSKQQQPKQQQQQQQQQQQAKQQQQPKKKPVPLGFTFSFPVDQVAINSGVLIQWTKGFSASGAVGEDVVEMLQNAFQRCGLGDDVNVVALANDTVGTMMTLAMKDSDCDIGLILGTGTNACYLEKIVGTKREFCGGKDMPKMVMNMEWGAFGDKIYNNNINNNINNNNNNRNEKNKNNSSNNNNNNNNNSSCLPRTSVDIAIDTNSNNPSQQSFEKMIAGMYLGEIARRYMVILIEKNLLFKGLGELPPVLNEANKFETSMMSDVAEAIAKGRDDEATTLILKVFGVPRADESDLNCLRRLFAAIAQRSARLTAAGIFAISKRIGKTTAPCHVAVDGSVFNKYPFFKYYLDTALFELEPRNSFKLISTDDGSGIGAAIIAAVASSK